MHDFVCFARPVTGDMQTLWYQHDPDAELTAPTLAAESWNHVAPQYA